MKIKKLLLLLIILNANTIVAQKKYDLKPVTVTAYRTPDTVFGTWKFNVDDYAFYEDKFILLTFEKNLEHAKVMLADATQKVLSTFELPDEAERLYKDYLGYINVICKEHIYRIKIKDDVIHLASLPVNDYRNLIMPCIDTIGKDIYFSNYQKDYPQFNYYAYNPVEKQTTQLKSVCDDESLKGYNMEYYFLKPKEQLEARKLEQEYKIDRHKIAAYMSGLTTSMFYTPLYAPLFIIADTAYVFDHYSNAILKYDKNHKRVDSVPITYHHPKNWRDWKHEVIVDKETNNVYAVYERYGIYSLKLINKYSGKIISSFKLTNKYVKQIKIRNGEVFYIYRPFESLQQQFIYKELIVNSTTMD